MKAIKVVVGANFGDEGKGRMTDYFCRQFGKENTVVVRFNSGAQAGHTVTMEDGRRHVFGHYGSGTLRGVPTCLSRFFIINPSLFLKERNELKGLVKEEAEPLVLVSSQCLVTTPYDMLLNQIIEKSRGENRHGSCGVGFFETIVRSRKEEYKVTAKDLMGFHINPKEARKHLEQKLRNIRDIYMKLRFKEQKVDEIDAFYEAVLYSDKLISDALDEMEVMSGIVTFMEIDEVFSKFDNIVFEGAQGLMLDQSFQFYPHVTPSNTGMKNVVKLLNESGQRVPKMELIYVSRCYMTRHGAGPLPNELKEKPYKNIVDLTNQPNEYQGTIRFAYFNGTATTDAIKDDLRNIPMQYETSISLAVTCQDQVTGKLFIQEGKEIKQIEKGQIKHYIQEKLHINKYYEGVGPTAKDTKQEEIRYASFSHFVGSRQGLRKVISFMQK